MTEEQQKVLDGLLAFAQEHRNGEFSGQALADKMEPIFQELGFRKELEPAAAAKQKILVLRDDAAGDFVLSSAFHRELRRIYPQAHITLFGSDRNHELAQCCPYIDNLIVNRREYLNHPFWDVFTGLARYVVEVLLPHHFDLGFSGRLGIKSADVLILYMAGVNRRVGFTQNRAAGPGRIAVIGWDVLLTAAVPLRARIESDADRDLFMLEYLPQLPIADRRLEMWLLDADRREAEQALAPLREERKVRRLYAVMPGASELFKEWPVERFAALLSDIMHQEKDLGLVVLGGPRDREKADVLAAKFGRRAVSLAGRLPFRVSAAVLSLCERYIGNDTGLMHMAAAQGLPVLTLFPYPASLNLFPMSCPVRFHPYGVPSVAVLPSTPADEKCRLMHGTGCAERSGPHCILGVTVEKMREGYALLNKCIREKRTRTVLLK
ncbi:MAG: glycosyltransferase family 9 protein [Desulfovibrio sp.]|nr:glycosyltransferase family 9 protein [Desulfovibrio sp.]